MDAQPVTPAPADIVAQVVASPGVARALAWAERRTADFAAETVRIAEIPAPTFHESARATYVAGRFRELGLQRIEIDATGNVYGLLPGDGRPAVALIAHLDTVFSADTPHVVSRRESRLYGPGIGDNAAGVAGMISAAAALQAVAAIPLRSVWLVASVGEEGLGNLCGVTAVANRIGTDVDAMVAVEGSFFGRLSYRGVGSRRLQVNCRTPGGHSWHDFGRPSAIHALVRVAAEITTVAPPSDPRTTFNIGRIEGGTGVNVIAEEARMLLDMRSVDAAALDELAARVRSLVRNPSGGGVQMSVDEVGFRPAGSLDARHALVQICAAVLRGMGVVPQCAPASTDANIPLSRGIPAVTLGITRGGGAHTRGEWIEIAPLARGIQQLIVVTMALADPRARLRDAPPHDGDSRRAAEC